MHVNAARAAILAGTAPAGLRVDGNLNLVGCLDLVSLPANLDVAGSLHLNSCAGLSALPAGLCVGCLPGPDGLHRT